MGIGEFIKSADWKNEKHAPVIDIPESLKPGEAFDATVTVGKEIAHPNTIEHHIKWFDLYVKYDDGQFLVHIGHAELTPVTCQPKVTFSVKLDKPGMLIATSYCNIHGLWEGSCRIEF
jgi:superoxide reductase